MKIIQSYYLIFLLVLSGCMKDTSLCNTKTYNTPISYSDKLLFPYHQGDRFMFLKNNKDTLVFTAIKDSGYAIHYGANTGFCPDFDSSLEAHKVILTSTDFDITVGQDSKRNFIVSLASDYYFFTLNDFDTLTQTMVVGLKTYTKVRKFNYTNGSSVFDVMYYDLNGGILEFSLGTTDIQLLKKF